MKGKISPIKAITEVCEKYNPTVPHDSPHEKIWKTLKKFRFLKVFLGLRHPVFPGGHPSKYSDIQLDLSIVSNGAVGISVAIG